MPTGYRTFDDMVGFADRHFVSVYRRSVDGWGTIHWPDGGALLDQAQKTVEGFAIVGAALAEFKKKGK